MGRGKSPRISLSHSPLSSGVPPLTSSVPSISISVPSRQEIGTFNPMHTADAGGIMVGVGGVLTGIGAVIKSRVRDTRKDKAFYSLIEDVRRELRECHDDRSRLDHDRSYYKTFSLALERGWLAYTHPDGTPPDPNEWRKFVSGIRREVDQMYGINTQREIAAGRSHGQPRPDSGTQSPRDAAS